MFYFLTEIHVPLTEIHTLLTEVHVLLTEVHKDISLVINACCIALLRSILLFNLQIARHITPLSTWRGAGGEAERGWGEASFHLIHS